MTAKQIELRKNSLKKSPPIKDRNTVSPEINTVLPAVYHIIHQWKD